MKFIVARAFYRLAICLPYWTLCPAKHHFLFIGSLNPDSCSTCRKNTDGLISSELQISKMLRREGFVLPNSMRLINARSYPDLAPRASWLIFNRNRRFRSSCPNATDRGSDCSLRKAPQPNVAPQVYYAPLIILAALSGWISR